MQFAKMHALGNDFMVIDGIHQDVSLEPENIQKWADRHKGVGFDQCLWIGPCPEEADTFRYRIFNADGSEVGQCANGARCAAWFIKHYGLSLSKTIHLVTNTTRMTLTCENNIVKLALPQPQLHLNNQTQSVCEITIPECGTWTFYLVDVGNPHAIAMVPDMESIPLATIGAYLQIHPMFPEGVNVSFVSMRSATHISMRVYERGVGETQACGSAAVATAAACHIHEKMGRELTICLLAGELQVLWPDVHKAIFLQGEVTFVYEGSLSPTVGL
jgi:diaminopimelate epimerase